MIHVSWSMPKVKASQFGQKVDLSWFGWRRSMAPKPKVDLSQLGWKIESSHFELKVEPSWL